MVLLKVLSRNCSCGRRNRERTSLAGEIVFTEIRVMDFAVLTAILRSQDKADTLCKELEDLNPGSQAIFIKKDISILKNVDEVCEELQRREKKINILFLSAGYMSLSGRIGECLQSSS
jgi:short-subunit dehydrogenase